MNKANRPLKVAFLGLRGFPNVQGGVETHTEHLCPILAELGCDVYVITRSPYQPASVGSAWKGVNFHGIWAPHSKGLEAILHTFLGVLYAGLVRRPDILHIQAIGPAIMAPFARMLGLRVVVTHHGPDYDRQKWGRIAKLILRTGEHWGMRFANERIVISKVIQDMVREKYGLESNLIPNGVVLPTVPDSQDTLKTFNLAPRKYVLLVSRLVPEKRHLDLIQAFAKANMDDWKLVLVGASDHPDEYTQKVLKFAEETPNVVCTGFQTGLALKELYANAGLFVLPSSHEGLPIALLEALSYGLHTICSDIPANLEVGLDRKHYYPLGDVNALAQRMVDMRNQRYDEEEIKGQREWLTESYNWTKIARSTLAVYNNACGRKGLSSVTARGEMP